MVTVSNTAIFLTPPPSLRLFVFDGLLKIRYKKAKITIILSSTFYFYNGIIIYILLILWLRHLFGLKYCSDSPL